MTWAKKRSKRALRPAFDRERLNVHYRHNNSIWTMTYMIDDDISYLEAVATNLQPTANAKVSLEIDVEELEEDPEVIIDMILDHLPVGKGMLHFTSASDYHIYTSHNRSTDTIIVRWATVDEVLDENEEWTQQEALETVHPSKRN